jgi:hypothetical protein
MGPGEDRFSTHFEGGKWNDLSSTEGSWKTAFENGFTAACSSGSQRTMSAWRQWQWSPIVDWTHPSAVLLRDFTKVISQDGDLRETPISVFGSSPIELGLGIALHSLDVDVEPDQFYVVAQKLAREARLTIGCGRSPYLQIVPPGVFRASRTWISRAEVVVLNGVSLRFAHPMDIIIGKLFRLEEKDYRGIDRIIQETGRPTRDDVHYYLTNYTDLFSTKSEDLKRFCDNVETFCAYREWEMIQANEIRDRVQNEIQEIYSEGDSVRKRMEDAFGSE